MNAGLEPPHGRREYVPFMPSQNKIYSIETKGTICLARALTVRDCYAIFKVLVTSKPKKFNEAIGFEGKNLKERWFAIILDSNRQEDCQIKEVSPKDFPLWVGSTYVSKEFEDLLKGEPCPS
jgi:hypothetical protein